MAGNQIRMTPESMAEKFGQLRPGFVNAKNLVDKISAALKKAAQILEDTDKNIAGQFRG